MLNALSVLLDGGNQDAQRRVARSMQRQGFVPAAHFTWDGGVLDGWSHPSQHDVENAEVRSVAGSALAVGPLWYRGRFGTDALRSLLDDINVIGRLDEAQLRGNFALFLHTPKQCLLLNDALGFVRIHASADGHFYSTSWLASCAYAGSVELEESAAAEYVLLGASHSTQTLARGVATLPMAHAVDLSRRQLLPRLDPNAWDEVDVPATFEAAVDRIAEHLRSVCTEVASAFPGRTHAALSGGFDSRLIVAGLLACGSPPQTFVYGDPDSEDVRIARQVAQGTGLGLKVVDKRALGGSAARPDLERLVRNGLFFDGLPNDGIYDSGADQATRLAQNADGSIALNGGGGEIFRNFFHLPDRPLRSADVVRAFYRGFDPRVFRRRDGLATWLQRLATSMETSLRVPSAAASRPLRRGQVELLYPLFRCHHWMSVNNSVSTRHGYYATPLVDLTAVRLAWQLPMAWKNAGRLESALVTRLHRCIAEQPSAYGFRFSDGPDWHARYKEWSTCARPVHARPYINAARRHLRKLGVTPDLVAYCRSLLPGEWQMDRVLDLQRLPDDHAFGRALAVEIAWRELLV